MLTSNHYAEDRNKQQKKKTAGLKSLLWYKLYQEYEQWTRGLTENNVMIVHPGVEKSWSHSQKTLLPGSSLVKMNPKAQNGAKSIPCLA